MNESLADRWLRIGAALDMAGDRLAAGFSGFEGIPSLRLEAGGIPSLRLEGGVIRVFIGDEERAYFGMYGVTPDASQWQAAVGKLLEESKIPVTRA